MTSRFRITLALVAALLPLGGTSAWSQAIGFISLTEGRVALVRGTTTYTVAEGARAQEGDMLSTEAKSQAHLQLHDGTLLNLGPGTRAMLMGSGELAILSGWAKVSRQKANPAKPLHIYTPIAQIAAEDATAVLHVGASAVEVFVESGSVEFARLGEKGTRDAPRTLKGGDFVAYTKGQDMAFAPRPAREFIKAMPRHFQDPLPVLPDKLKDRKIEPKREHEAAYADVEDWLNANLAIRKGFVKRFQARARDPEFRVGLVKNLREHPEWDRTLFPEKYKEPK